ncbi:MFS transporter [Legionella sp. D16C41]|uniref:MFS transporter n=1 Tax=Legionella sp. D16C41 TaxID=3402688 RepID=UPI003AF7BA7B
MSTIATQQKIITFAIVNGLIAQFAMDIYIPSMPAMVKAFKTINDTIQFSYFYFMLGFGLAIFCYGFLRKLINYRTIFILCNTIFLLATLAIIYSDQITYFLFFRFIQGLGAGLGSMAIIIALIYLMFSPAKLGIYVSYAVFFLTTANILAPLLGGYLQEFYDWQSNFIFLFILAFLLLILSYFLLPNIIFASSAKKGFSITKVRSLLANKQYITHVIYAIICVNIIVCYLIMSSFILQMHLGISTRIYGWIASLVSLLFSLGSLCNSMLLNRYLPKHLIYVGLIISFFGIASFFAASYFATTSVTAFIIPMTISALGLGILYPNFVACGFINFTSFIIDATSLLSILKITIICLFMIFIALLPDTFFICALLTSAMYSLLLFLILIFNREYLI